MQGSIRKHFRWWYGTLGQVWNMVKKITLPPLPLDFDLKTQNRDHPSFKNARVRQGCAPPNPKTPRIWGFHFCHHLRRAKRGGLLTCTYFALPPSAVPERPGHSGFKKNKARGVTPQQRPGCVSTRSTKKSSSATLKSAAADDHGHAQRSKAARNSGW